MGTQHQLIVVSVVPCLSCSSVLLMLVLESICLGQMLADGDIIQLAIVSTQQS